MPEEVDALSRAAFGQDGHVQMGALGQSCVNLAAMAGFTAGSDTKVLLAPLPADPVNSRNIRWRRRS